MMKIIAIEKKESALEFFRKKPVPSFTTIAQEVGVHRVTLYHWYKKYERGDLSWCEPGKRSFSHYSVETISVPGTTSTDSTKMCHLGLSERDLMISGTGKDFHKIHSIPVAMRTFWFAMRTFWYTLSCGQEFDL